MRYSIFILTNFILSLGLRADPPPEYYLSAENKRGEDLSRALHLIIKGHRVIAYSGGATNTGDALKVLDENPANTNNVLCVYSRKSEAKSSLGSSGGWNREHLWCNIYGIDSKLPSYSDLHNLRPEDSNVNSSRGNKFFDDSNPLDPSYRNPAHIEAPLATADSDSWAPPPEVRGDIARSLFYMATRYTGDPTNEPALRLTDSTSQITSSTNLMGRLSTLLEWHHADPVDASERKRNDLVFSLYQHNRNPFVDNPGWVDSIFAPVLHLTVQGGNIVMTWPSQIQGAVLEAATEFSGPWRSITNQPAIINDEWSVTLPVTENEYLRLHLH